MKLGDIRAPKGAKRNRKRVGRGHASGWGKTSGTGHKGQKSRSGGGVRPGFEGGQMPLHRRLPKFGFTNIFRKVFAEINLRDLGRIEGDRIDAETLAAAGLVESGVDGIKILGDGEIDRAVTVMVDKVTAQARQKIEAAGGSIELNQTTPRPVEVDVAKAERRIQGDVIDLPAIMAAGLAPEGTERVKLVKRGILRQTTKTFKGVLVSRQARRIIALQGGKIEEN